MSSYVARRYKFHASHEAVGLPAPWCERHEHDYTIEVVYSDGLDVPFAPVVIDTDEVDAAWEERIASLCRDQHLNDTIGGATTVEDLARRLWHIFRDTIDGYEPPYSVTVWEDDDRWGRFEP